MDNQNSRQPEGQMNAISGNAQALKDIKWLMQAVSKDPTRYTISRLWVDEARAVCTDGHRIHFIEKPSLPTGFSIRGSEWDGVLSLNTHMPLSGIEYDGYQTRWTFAGGRGVLTFDVNRDQFVDYAHTFPKDGEIKEMSTKDLRKVFVGGEGQPQLVDFSWIGPAHFNARYIAEALKGAPKVVSVQISADSCAPVMFKYDNRGAVVMPLRG
jgi:hypothetical protein